MPELTDKSDKNYILNFFRTHRFDQETILLITDQGDWVSLSKEEYDELIRFEIEDSNLFNELLEAGIILKKENIGQEVEKYRERQKRLFTGPSLHIVIPTLDCNQGCLYCHSMTQQSSNSDQVSQKYMDKATAEKIVDFIFETSSPKIGIEFQGGECSLNFPVMRHTIDYALEKADNLRDKGREVDLRFSVVSNLTNISQARLDKLIKIIESPEHGILSLNTSLDGPKELHDKQRPYLDGKGSYDDVVDKIELIRESYQDRVNLTALATITRYSLDYGHQIIDEYRKRGFDNIWLRPLNKLGVADKNWNQIGYASDQFLSFWKEQLDYILKLNSQGANMREFTSYILAKNIIGEEPVNVTEWTSPCGAGTSQLLYNPKGEVFVCDESKLFDQFKLGTVDQSMDQLLDSKTLKTMVDVSSKKPLICDSCEWSPYCSICPVLAYSNQGNVIPTVPDSFQHKVKQGMIEHMFRKIINSEDEREKFLFQKENE